LLLLLLQVVATLTQVNNGDRPLVYPSCTRERNGRLCQKKLQGQEGSWCVVAQQQQMQQMQMQQWLVELLQALSACVGRASSCAPATCRNATVPSCDSWQATRVCLLLPAVSSCRFCETCSTTVEQPAYRYLLNVVVSAHE
jgi:hypothetical protein